MNDNTIFDRDILRLARNRRASNWQDYNWLKQEAASRLVDTLFDIKQNFALALDLGCHGGELGQIMLASGKVGQVISCDLAEKMNPQIVCDEEFLPFADNCFDLVTSCLALHNVNDLVGSLVQIRSSLKPGGFFIATIYGVNTLKELRESAVDAACLLDFPLSPRVAPFVDIRDAGALLQRSGFALPVASSEEIVVNYSGVGKILDELRGAGEANILSQRSRKITPLAYFAAIDQCYSEKFAMPEGGVAATFELITLAGVKA